MLPQMTQMSPNHLENAMHLVISANEVACMVGYQPCVNVNVNVNHLLAISKSDWCISADSGCIPEG